MSTPLEQLCNQLRARIETVGDDLVHVAQGQGAFTNPVGVYMTVSLAVGALEVVLYEMRRNGMVP
jgi:hypothetical protein